MLLFLFTVNANAVVVWADYSQSYGPFSTAELACKFLAERVGDNYIRTEYASATQANCFSGNNNGDVRNRYQAFSYEDGKPAEPPVPSCPASGSSAGNVNMTTGYSPSLTGASTVAIVANGAWTSTDSNSCVINVSPGVGPSACYGSQTPSSTGLYRLSCDFPGVYSGSTSAAGPNANAAPPLCPGSNGSVNGVPVCLVSGSPSTSGSEKPPLAGNPVPGSKPGPEAQQPYPATSPSNPGSAIGSASGGGSGGASGGGGGTNGNPTDAGRSNTPSGSTGNANNPLPPKPPGPVECGTPGRPNCQIDDSQIGSAAGVYEPSIKALSDTQKFAADQIASAASAIGKDTGWKFSFSLPTQCSAFPLFLNVVADFCRFQPMIHDLMSLVWVSTTFFVLIGMFGRAQRGTA